MATSPKKFNFKSKVSFYTEKHSFITTNTIKGAHYTPAQLSSYL